MIGPLPPGLYIVAAEVLEAGCSILTEPFPLDGARSATASHSLAADHGCGSARQRSRRWAGSTKLRAR